MRISRFACHAALVLGVGLLGGCGGNDPDPLPSPSPTPTPCIQTTAFTDEGKVPANTAVYVRFSTAATGRLDITMDWTFPASVMAYVVVAADGCPFEALQAGTCTFLTQAGGPGSGIGPGTKPIKQSTANFAAGNYDLILLNPNSEDESISIQAVVSQGPCAALASTPQGSGSSAGRLDVRGIAGWVSRLR